MPRLLETSSLPQDLLDRLVATYCHDFGVDQRALEQARGFFNAIRKKPVPSHQLLNWVESSGWHLTNAFHDGLGACDCYVFQLGSP